MENFLLTIGSDLQHATYKTKAEISGIDETGNDVAADAYGFYVQEKVILDNWVFRVGGRYSYTKHDYDEIGGTEPSEDGKSWNRFLWSAGIRYNVSKSIGIYANVGSTFLVPSAKSVGGTLKLSDRGVPGKNGQLPNPSLKPEKGLGFDIGSDVRLTSNLLLGVRGFYNTIDNAIVENVVSNNPSQSQSVNAGKSRAYGLEIEGEYQINSVFKCFANSTITQTDVENNVDADRDNSNVPFVPDVIANLGISASLPYEVTISPYFQYVDRYYDSSSKSGRSTFGEYGVVNVKARKQLYNNRDFTADLVVDVNNMLNKKFEMPWQFQDPGFNTLASIVATF
ncbi:MAG: TonB-dependent receptor [Candidatus Brocadia sp.]|jgi:outer membrane receptor protein involved in Fe transport